MSDPDKQRLQSAALQLMGLILCASALWFLRRWQLPLIMGDRGTTLLLKHTLYLILFAPALIWFLWRMFELAANEQKTQQAGVFVVGVFCVGLGLGLHDAAANIGAFGVKSWSPQARDALYFYDETIGHLAFWLGFILTTVSTGLAHLSNPMQTRQSLPTCALFVLLGIPLAVVMLGNLIYERTGRDLVAIAIALVIILAMHARKRVELRRVPLLCLLYPAYAVAIIGTLAFWAMK